MNAPERPQAATPWLPLKSRLPAVGTTIFTVMSALAQEHQAVNLGQGFPDFGCDPQLLEGVHQAMHAGMNQYPPMAGVAALREAGVDAVIVDTSHGHSRGVIQMVEKIKSRWGDLIFSTI